MGIQSSWERRVSARNPDTTFPELSTSTVIAPAWGVHCPVLQLPATPVYHALVPQRGQLDAPSRDSWSALFLEKLLAETQTVIELCSFGKGTVLPHLQHTAGTPLPWHHPAEFSCTEGSHCGTFRVCLLGRLLSRNQMSTCWAVWLQGGHSYLPCELSPHYPRKKCLLPLTGLLAPPPTGDCLDVTATQSQWPSHAELSSTG